MIGPHVHMGPIKISRTGAEKARVNTEVEHMIFKDISVQSTLRNCSIDMSEKLCLQWNDFQENIEAAFGDLREDKHL